MPSEGSMPSPNVPPSSYDQPPPYGSVPVAMRNGMGTAALVLGILAIVGSITVIFGALFGIIAVVLGVLGRGRAKRHEATNGSSATAGLVCGILGLVLSAVILAVGIAVFSSGSGKTLRDCLDNAGSNAREQQRCQVVFTDNFRR